MNLPKGWVIGTLGEICQFENGDRGKNYSGRSTFVSSGIPFISAGHLRDGNISWETMNYIPQENYDRLGSGKVKSGDFLFCLRGSLGKHAFVPLIQEGAISSSLIIVRPSREMHSPFIDSYFRSPLIDGLINHFSNGSAQPNLSSDSLAKFELPIPPAAEQRRIVAKLDALTSRISRARAELERVPAAHARKLLDRLESAILAKAFRGELVPQDENDEPAEKLLERIRAERAAAPKAKRGRKSRA
ncbi:restriction endonuclease subunit S [Agrobacterium tumefaciens]|uniref:restriction endonuclease subunit S n=1 Tax=Agrobacterium tumefaciens TaxID=358 RepID=UPI000EF25B0B|nr:hypothetical protein At1D1108_26800 [Agrobacterium tumefaciens]NSY91459.1 restriction endonuclease subunit S [Agrobacterium tumefaciens]